MCRILWAFTALLVPGFAMSVQAASFDCTQAREADEIAICKHRDLSERDTEMGALWFAYRRVPMYMGTNGVRYDDADDFLKRRAACGSDAACLRRIYHARIKALRDDFERAMKAVRQQESEAAAVPPSALPAPVEAIITGYTDQCRKLGGALAAGADRPKIMTGDFDGDGKTDYVLNPQNLQCSAAATAFCGNGGCQIAIAVSGNNYQEPIMVLGGQPTLSQRSDGTKVEVWVNSSNCKLSNREKACWASYSWRDGKVSRSNQARPLTD